MKLARGLFFFIFLHLCSIAEEQKEYEMTPLKFVFSEEEDVNNYCKPDSYWSLNRGLYTITVYLEHILTEDELICFLSGIVIHIAPYVDESSSENMEMDLSFSQDQSMTNMIRQSNLDKIESRFGKANMQLFKRLLKSNVCFSEWDMDCEKNTLKVSIPKKISEHIYKKAFVYAMNSVNLYMDSNLKKSEYFQCQTIVEEAALVCRVLSLRMLIRTLVEPELFAQDEQKIVFYSIKDARSEEIRKMIENHPTYIGDSANAYITYVCPPEWESVITSMDYPQLIQRLQRKLDSLFPERTGSSKGVHQSGEGRLQDLPTI